MQNKRQRPNKYTQQKITNYSLDHPEQFWLDQAHKLIDWHQPPTTALSYREGPTKKHLVDWFPDGKLNLCYNALDRHVRDGYGEQTAVIYDSPVTQTKRRISYALLLDQVVDFSKVLVYHYHVKQGDTVVIYMPMIPHTMVAMLACARIGAIHSVVFGGFAPIELAKRIDDCRANLVISASCGIERPDKFIEYIPLLHTAITRHCQYKPAHKLVYIREALPVDLPKYNSESNGYSCWSKLVATYKNSPPVPIAIVDTAHPLYMLYTSGTTGAPKGVVRPSGSHAVALVYAMRHVYGSNPGEAFFASSDFGWAVGHSLTCYGALMNRNETVVYEGKPVGTPDPGAFFRVLSEYNVTVFFTSPTALMILRKEDNDAKYRRKYDLSHVRGLFLAGERCVPEIHRWWINYITNNNPTATSAACSNSHDIARAPEFSFAYMDGSPTNPVVNVSTDHWWQTESGSPLTAICLGDITAGADIPPIRFGSAGMALPGVDLRILRTHSDDGDEDDTSPKSTDRALEEAAPGEIGSVVIKLPLPPGCFSGLWKNDKKFFTEYFERFPGYYATGDAGFVDADGYVFILSRDDDVINVAAHRLSTSTVEETATRHPTVAECCVVPRPHNIKGQVPVVFAVLKSGSYTPSQLADAKSQIAAAVRSNIGAIVSLLPENIFFVEKLPKTRSGKILRKLLRNMFTAIADHTADTNRGSSRLSTTVIPLDLPATMEDFAVAYDIWKQLLDTPHVYSKL